ncbi:hypothetical protein EJB05_49338 [Eragrostis curvula]|uniref:Uncharacterized protein n=1 Tax=Eragrostis curvula TaxID=38414 RepID=A0A5J9T499_9POAL|nr:hypothetical protein EJB05_49338 [Eragrostis curvula]
MSLKDFHDSSTLGWRQRAEALFSPRRNFGNIVASADPCDTDQIKVMRPPGQILGCRCRATIATLSRQM